MATDWLALIDSKRKLVPEPITLVKVIRTYKSYALPIMMSNASGIWMVKGLTEHDEPTMQSVVTDHVVARLGIMLGAPIPSVDLVEIPAKLVINEPSMKYHRHGIAHGSRYVPDLIDSRSIRYIDLAENRSRFADIAVLYGWLYSRDQQLCYAKKAPQVVYTIDHGWFFPNGPKWLLSDLRCMNTGIDDTVSYHAQLTVAEIDKSLDKLEHICDNDVAYAVACLPDEWGVTSEMRVTIAKYASHRRDILLAIFGRSVKG